jgi:uncharacterized protein YjbI with pentapeptide repeats
MGPETPDSPGPVPNPKPYILRCCIKMRDPAPRLVWLQTVRSLIILPIGKNCQVDQEQTTQERARELVSWLVPNWRPTERQVLWAIRIAIVLGVVIAIGSTYGITLWDWAQLLIIPAVIAGGGIWFNQRQQEREFEIADQRVQATALQAFLDQITHSTAYRELRTAAASGHKRALLRAKLQTLLLQLDEKHKGLLLSFLHGAKLSRKKEITPYEYTKEYTKKEREEKGEEPWKYPILSLDNIDFSRTKLTPGTKLTFDDLRGIILRGAKLSKVNLSGANLTNADLRDADLSGAQLRKADPQDSERIPGEFHNEYDKAVDKEDNLPLGLLERLLKTDLSRANLSGANLSYADLSYADLSYADLSGASLREADMSGAHLSGARGITNEQLEQQAKSLEGAIMPDGQKYEDWIKNKGSGEDGENSSPS